MDTTKNTFSAWYKAFRISRHSLILSVSFSLSISSMNTTTFLKTPWSPVRCFRYCSHISTRCGNVNGSRVFSILTRVPKNVPNCLNPTSDERLSVLSYHSSSSRSWLADTKALSFSDLISRFRGPSALITGSSKNNRTIDPAAVNTVLTPTTRSSSSRSKLSAGISVIFQSRGFADSVGTLISNANATRTTKPARTTAWFPRPRHFCFLNLRRGASSGQSSFFVNFAPTLVASLAKMLTKKSFSSTLVETDIQTV